MKDNMDKQEVMAKLRKHFLNEMVLDNVTEDDLQEDTIIFGDGLGLDSIDAVELVVLIEKHFKIEIEDAQEAKKAFASFGVLADYIMQRMPGNA